MTPPHRTRYFQLECEPDELIGALDPDALLAEVVSETHDGHGIIYAALIQNSCRIKVMPGSEIESVAHAMGVTTGLRGCTEARALFLEPRCILVPRLDWRGLLAHELVHLCQTITNRPRSESEAAAVADAVS